MCSPAWHSKLARMLSALCVLLAWPMLATPPATTLSPAEENRILSQIRAKGRNVFENYAGIASLRHSEIRIYDGTPVNGKRKLREHIRISAERRDYYTGMPEVKVLRYNKNGQELPPSDFENVEFEPPVPLFDQNGDRNYHFSLGTPRQLNGQLCYPLHVEPRALTARHFRGTLYFSVDGLRLRFMTGTYARLQIGLQSFSFSFYFEDTPAGVPVFVSGSATGRIYFPLVRDEYIESSMIMENARPIRRGPQFER